MMMKKIMKMMKMMKTKNYMASSKTQCGIIDSICTCGAMMRIYYTSVCIHMSDIIGYV